MGPLREAGESLELWLEESTEPESAPNVDPKLPKVRNQGIYPRSPATADPKHPKSPKEPVAPKGLNGI